MGLGFPHSCKSTWLYTTSLISQGLCIWSGVKYYNNRIWPSIYTYLLPALGRWNSTFKQGTSPFHLPGHYHTLVPQLEYTILLIYLWDRIGGFSNMLCSEKWQICYLLDGAAVECLTHRKKWFLPTGVGTLASSSCWLAPNLLRSL